MTGNSEDSEWQKLSWAEKVQICQQRIAQEDSLLIAYVVIFIGIEAMFFAFMLSSNIVMPYWLGKIIPALGILVAINFALVCKRRGDMIDRWSVVFYSVWKKVPDDETIASICLNKNLVVKAKDIGEDYKGCVERLTGRWRGWKPIIFGWGRKRDRLKFCLKSARRLVTIFTPILVIMIWIFILITD